MIAYAIVRAGYPREAISAVVVGHALVFGCAVFLLPLQEVLPVSWLRLGAAILLTAMGLYWSFKSLKRLIENRRPHWVSDPLGEVNVQPAQPVQRKFSLFVFLVMGKSALVEAGEILVVALPVGATTGAWLQVVLGVLAGISVVMAVALALHGRLNKVPEVKLKFATGLVLTAIGLYWLLEAYGDWQA